MAPSSTLRRGHRKIRERERERERDLREFVIALV